MRRGHLITTLDYTKAELLDLIELTRMLKEADRLGFTPKLLQGLVGHDF